MTPVINPPKHHTIKKNCFLEAQQLPAQHINEI